MAAWSVAVAETIKEAEAVGLRSSFDRDFSPSALEMSPGISGSILILFLVRASSGEKLSSSRRERY